jgi:hypothetical protein
MLNPAATRRGPAAYLAPPPHIGRPDRGCPAWHSAPSTATTPNLGVGPAAGAAPWGAGPDALFDSEHPIHITYLS